MNDQQQTELDHKPAKHSRKYYLYNIRRSWIFWLFLLLMFAGIGYYIFTLNFSFVPVVQ